MPNQRAAEIRAAYDAFLRAKVAAAPSLGFEISIDDVNPACKDHVRAIVKWGVRKGCAGYFSSFGLQKTTMQEETVRLVVEHAGGRGLIVCPLNVRQEFARDAIEILGWPNPPRFVRASHEVAGVPSGIYITNWESVREGKFDPRLFTVVSLDEADALRSFGSKTFGEVVICGGWDQVPYRFVASATPDPNDYLELLGYAQFLGVMDIGQAKTRFFKRDSEHADQLTLHEHKEEEFWLWVASWAIVIQKPSDLGFSDDGYELPPLDVRWHEIPSDHADAGTEKSGQRRLHKNVALGVQQASKEKRESLRARVGLTMEIISHALHEEDPQGVLPAESGKTEGKEPGLVPREQAAHLGEGGSLEGSPPRAGGGAEEAALPASRGATEEGASRSVCRLEGAGEAAEACDPSGTVRADAGSVPGHPRRARRRLRNLHGELPDRQNGGRPRSQDRCGARDPLSTLQHRAGPDGRSGPEAALGGRILGGDPGRLHQVVVWCDLNSEQRAVERGLDLAGISYSSIDGSTSLDERQRGLAAWRNCETVALIGKATMMGAGLNLQQAHHEIFVGISYRFRDVIQAVHRCHRFGQQHQVRVDLIYTEAERAVRLELEAKWARHKAQTERVSKLIRELGLAEISQAAALTRSLGCERQVAEGKRFRLVRNDSVYEGLEMDDDSVDLIAGSPAFSTQYEYSPSYNDFGHTDNAEHYWEQMEFLLPEMFRVLRPGRVCAIHVKDRIVDSGMTGLGFQVVHPFHAEAIFKFARHGFAFLGMKSIATDVVRENAGTYRLGYTEQCKDGSRMGAGLCEYLLLFRKPQTDRSRGYADVPVVKSKEEYSRARWQFDAHGFMRSSGDRLLTSAEVAKLSKKAIWRLFRQHSANDPYDFEKDVAIGEALERAGRLPPDFMLLQPVSNHPDIWTDIVRMRTFNGAQSQRRRVKHLCPLQIDLVDRVIVQCSNEGEVIWDPWAGLGTVPVRAIKHGRVGWGCELSGDYWTDSVFYARREEADLFTPTLLDLMRIDGDDEAIEEAMPAEASA